MIIFIPLFSFSQSGFSKLFDEKKGLSQKSINTIVKDQNGIIWLGTETGLVKFDGLSFCEITPTSQYYKKSEIINIKIKENTLFLIYRNKGCIAYNINTLNFKEITQKPILDLEPITENIYYILHLNGHLFKHIGSKVVTLNNINLNITTGRIAYFCNKLFLATDIGIKRFNGITNTIESWYQYPENNFKGTSCFEFCVSKQYLHFINDGSVYKIDSVSNKNTKAAIQPTRLKFHEYITSYLYSNKSKYYYIYNNRKLVRGEILGGNEDRIIYNLNSFDNIQFKNIYTFDTLNLLVGTNQGLLWISKRDSEFIHINDNKYFDSIVRVRRSILELNKNEILFFGNPSVIKYKFNTNEFCKLIDKGTFYNSVLVDNKIYATTQDSGLVLLNDNFKSYKTIYTSKGANRINAGLLYDSNRNVIISGGVNYLIFYYPKTPKCKIIKIDLKCGLVKAIVKDVKNKLYWLGTDKGLIAIDYSGRLKLSFTGNKIGNISRINDLVILNNNTQLWIAHSRGVNIFNLVTLDSFNKLPIHPKLLINSVAIKQDLLQRIWISTYEGLILYNPRDNNILHFVKGVDLINQEFNYSSCLVLKNGSMIFGGINGYDIIDPYCSYFKKKASLPEVSSVFRISNKDTIQCIINNVDAINYEADKEILKIFIHHKDLIKEFDYSFEYSIDNKTWENISSNTPIFIVNLSPGIHELRIRSVDNIYDESSYLFVKINAVYPIHKTLLFAWGISLFTLFIILLYILTLSRIYKIERFTKEQIAMDLHDDVGSTLTRALFHSRKFNNHVVTNLIEDSLKSLRAYIQSLNFTSVDLYDLVDDLRDMLEYLSIDSNVNVQLNYTIKKNVFISSSLYRDLKLVFYEIVANNQKHSYCTNFKADLELKKSMLKIRLVDNGILNNIEKLYIHSNGINNITKRIRRHGGEIIYSINTEGSGLCVDISLKI